MSKKLGLEKVQEKLIISQISKEWVNFLSNQSYILCYKSFIDSKLFEVERNIRFHVFHSTLLPSHPQDRRARGGAEQSIQLR